MPSFLRNNKGQESHSGSFLSAGGPQKFEKLYSSECKKKITQYWYDRGKFTNQEVEKIWYNNKIMFLTFKSCKVATS